MAKKDNERLEFQRLFYHIDYTLNFENYLYNSKDREYIQRYLDRWQAMLKDTENVTST